MFIFSFFFHKSNFNKYKSEYFFISTFIIFCFGLADDILQVSPFIKLGAQFSVATLTWGLLLRLNSLSIDLGSFTWNKIKLFFSYLITIFWIVGIINAINWLDGLDGLAAGFSFIVFISLIFIPQNNFSISYTNINIALAGGCLGFLFFNLYPSKIIMGDCGSNFLGYNIAILTLLSGTTTFSGNLVNSNLSFFPILILLIPILDMSFVIFCRLKDKKSPFFPDKRHLHHRLLDYGLDIPSAVFCILLITEILSLFATYLIKGNFPFLIFIIYLAFDIFIIAKTKQNLFKF